MIKSLVVLMTFILTQSSCNVSGEYYEGLFRPHVPPDESRQELERLKREFLQIEDLKIGTGPLAAHGRKITADVVIRYVGDGTVAYQGPVVAYSGMEDSVGIHNSLRESGMLSLQQMGILFGLNGMAVGGKRFFTIAPKLICAWNGSEKSNPGSTCGLVIPSKKGFGGMVRKEALNVEATLTSACAPLYHGGRPTGKEDLCRDSELPRRDPTAPIWRFYYAEPLQP